MKKILALLLAVAVLFSLSMVAFAGSTLAAEVKTYELTKEYVTTAGNKPATFPQETLTFTVVPASTNPSNAMITVANLKVDSNPDKIVVTTPAYTTPGMYNYTVTENKGNTQGVTYNTDAINVQVLVTFNDGHSQFETQTVFSLNSDKGTKIKEIVNKYDLGGFSVKKEIKGNLADPTDEFEITVRLQANGDICSDITYAGKENGTVKAADWDNGAWTKTFKLSAEDTINFTNIPAGVIWDVFEADYTTGVVNDKNYGYEEAVYDENCKGTVVADKTVQTVIINEKGTEVDTGIALDSIPYIVMLFVAAAAAVLFLRKKSYEA